MDEARPAPAGSDQAEPSGATSVGRLGLIGNVILTGVVIWFIVASIRDDRAFDWGVAWVCEQYAAAAREDIGPLRSTPPRSILDPGDYDSDEFDEAVMEKCGSDLLAARDAQGERTGALTTTGDPESGALSVDSSVRDVLRAAGVDDAEADALGVVAYETGYIWRSRPPTVAEVERFAYIAVLECRDVAAGERTWGESAAEAIASGVSQRDAQRMTSYLESTFCPALA